MYEYFQLETEMNFRFLVRHNILRKKSYLPSETEKEKRKLYYIARTSEFTNLIYELDNLSQDIDRCYQNVRFLIQDQLGFRIFCKKHYGGRATEEATAAWAKMETKEKSAYLDEELKKKAKELNL